MKYLPYILAVATFMLLNIFLSHRTIKLNLASTSSGVLEQTVFPEWNNRDIVRCQSSNIAFSYNLKENPQTALFSNIFTYNFYDNYDYFCIPDNFLMAYNDQSFYRNKILAMNWDVDKNVSADQATAIITNTHQSGQGFNQSAINTLSELSAYRQEDITEVPANITIKHEINCNQQFIPVTITVKNTDSEPLRFVYMLFDGAWMTSFAEQNQSKIDQIWPEEDYQYQHIQSVDEQLRRSKQAWFGLYDPANGGMFAGIYAPPASHGVRYFFTRDELSFPMPNKPTISNILSLVDVDNHTIPFNQQEYKIHNTLIDFGVLQPGEERTQIIVKIMFTDLTGPDQIRKKVNEIVATISDYELPVYDLEDYDDY